MSKDNKINFPEEYKQIRETFLKNLANACDKCSL